MENSTLTQRIIEIEKKTDLILEILNRIDSKKLQPPYDPFLYPKNTCSKCGLALDGVMGYVCSDRECPTFLTVSF